MISSLRRSLKRGPTIIVRRIYIRTMFNKQTCDLEVPTLYCAEQWRVAAVVPGIEIGAVSEQ